MNRELRQELMEARATLRRQDVTKEDIERALAILTRVFDEIEREIADLRGRA